LTVDELSALDRIVVMYLDYTDEQARKRRPMSMADWAGELEKLPNATYRAFERSGHYPHLDEREPFGEAVAGWLGRSR
jgi:hypothetical protein